MSVGLSEAHREQGPVEFSRDEVLHLELAKGIPVKRAEPSNTGLKKKTLTHKDKNKTFLPLVLFSMCKNKLLGLTWRKC